MTATETALPARAGKPLSVSLWVVQVLLAIAFGFAGVAKATTPLAELAANMPNLPGPLLRFVGVAEIAGALGLLLPSLTRIRPALTPLAGLGLSVIMTLAAAHHVIQGEYTTVPVNLVLGALAAFVAWGRFKRAPIAAR